MGIRCDQFFGLNAWASKLTKPTLIHVGYCEKTYKPELKRQNVREELYEPDITMENTGETYGMEDIEYPLNEYTFPNGRKVREFLQASPWSSGPCLFLALKEEYDGEWKPIQESLWTDEEISQA